MKKCQENLEQRKNDILNKQNEIETKDMTYLGNARSISLLNKALEKLQESLIDIEEATPIDIIEFSLKDSWEYLGEIIGETANDQIINEVFSRFCLGK